MMSSEQWATPLHVNPSMGEVWSSNFESVQEFYEKNGHLTLPWPRLKSWLTYQRRHAKSLKGDQLERLESIRYNKTSIFRACDVDAWEAKFVLLKESRDKYGNFIPRDGKLASWLTRQKKLSSMKQ